MLGLALACGGVDPKAVSPTGSPDHGTTITHSFQGMDIPVGTGEVKEIDHRRITVAYRDDRDMDAEMARYDAWAVGEGWTQIKADQVPLEKQVIYERGDVRLVLKFGALGRVGISTVP